MELKNDWNRLCNLKESCPILFSFEIFKIYYERILKQYNDFKIEIIVVKNENQRIVAIFPFTIEIKKLLPFLWVKQLSIKDNYLIGFYIFLVDPQEKSQFIFHIVINYLKKMRKTWNIIKFFDIPQNERLYNEFVSIFHQNYKILVHKTQTVIVDSNRDFAEYTNNIMKGKDRRNLKRLIRRLNERGVVNFIELYEKKDVKVGLENFYDIEDKNWKGKMGTSLKKSYYGEFYEKLAFHLADINKLKLYFLQLNGEYIAGIYAIVDKEICYLIKIGYLEDFSHYSPSNILFYLTFDYLFAQTEIKKIDFYGPFYEYQKIWRESTREKYNLTIFNDRFSSTLYFLMLITLKKFSNLYLMKLLFLKFKNKNLFKKVIKRFYS